MHILVCGGAGYIGSHMVKMLHASGHDVTTLDNLSSGHRDAVRAGRFELCDLGRPADVRRVFERGRFDAVMQFAASIEVSESMTDPRKYFCNNLVNTLNLLDVMLQFKVSMLVFSSTAAVYGEPRQVPIPETHARDPINAYGASKRAVEDALTYYAHAYNLRSASLRYFNAAGADPQGELGERHDPETHLIPLVLRAASGRRPDVTVFGRDYDTPDGTCVRDFIHVMDLCAAHLRALEYLAAGGETIACNLGTGKGCSVQELIDAATRVTGNTITVRDAARRTGDPARLIADPGRAMRLLGWEPEFSDIDTIVAHAWAWERKLRTMEPALTAAAAS
jgi:UDP-glucose 4-epimerase